MLSDPVIAVENISKCYQIYNKPRDRLVQMFYGKRKQFFKEFWAVKDVSFTINRGEALGIIGKNGSGKSTLLQLICETLTPTRGRIKTRGKIAALLELGSGFNIEFTGRENVFMCATLYGLTQAEIEARFDKIATFADIGDYIDQPVKTYSSGMYVRLAFSVIAHIDATILIIDEALSVGDAFFQQKCMRFLRHFRENGTLIFVSHDSGAVINLCDRALLLNQGQLVMDSTPKEVTDAYLSYLYEEQQGKSYEGFKQKTDLQLLADPEDNLMLQQSFIPEYEPFATSFGSGEGVIVDVWLEDAHGNKLHHAFGDDEVALCVKVMAKKEVEQPIIGFQVKDRLGQIIFGNNTYLTYQNRQCLLQDGSTGLTKFNFVMPFLKAGYYSVAVAFAEGTQENHIQLHWVHDAMIFEIYPADIRCKFFDGMIGVPIKDIELMVL
jgi:lipopolysaccharide transport system ATP-binding protein